MRSGLRGRLSGRGCPLRRRPLLSRPLLSGPPFSREYGSSRRGDRTMSDERPVRGLGPRRARALFQADFGGLAFPGWTGAG